MLRLEFALGGDGMSSISCCMARSVNGTWDTSTPMKYACRHRCTARWHPNNNVRGYETGSQTESVGWLDEAQCANVCV